MSDDRFKQARRSLIDRHNQRQQDDFDDSDFEDEATAMVDLDSMDRGFPPPPGYQPGQPQQPVAQQHQQAPQQHQPQGRGQQPQGHGQQAQQGGFPPPPSYQQPGAGGADRSGQAPSFGPPPSFGNAAPAPRAMPGDEATEMFSVQEYEQAQPLPSPQPSTGGVPMGGGGVQMGHGGGFDAPSASAQVVIGDDVGYEGSTQFINIADLAAEGGQSVAPDEGAVGYEGSTQFVDLNALQVDGPHAAMTVEGDPVLNQGYQFARESIQEGEFTLIFAQNMMGASVVLKRIWEGDATTMPFELRQRLAALDPIRHPRLVALNGVVTTPSGAWVELARPAGYRLTDIIAQNGPQPVESVQLWLQQMAEVLSVVHQYQFVYANLTTDAIWVQDDGSIVMEPFDVLTFENRGNLGAFGPPELSQPPETRIVSPSTDVYSMAAVAVAALSGLPLNLQAAQAVDPAIGVPSMAALSQNPAERPLTPLDFATLVSGTGGKAGGKSKLPDLNIKIIAPIIVVVGLLVVGLLYMKQQSDAQAAAEAAIAADAVAAQKVEKDAKTDGNDATGTNNGTNNAATPEVVGSLETDDRLTIKRSYEDGKTGEVAGVDSLGPEEQAALRAEANEAIKDIKRLTARAQNERYTMALKKIAELQRGSGGKLEPADQEFLADLLATSRVKKIRKENLDQVNEALKAEKLTTARLFYQQIEAVDGEANARGFFGKNKSAKISKLERGDTPPAKKEAGEKQE